MVVTVDQDELWRRISQYKTSDSDGPDSGKQGTRAYVELRELIGPPLTDIEKAKFEWRGAQLTED